ncbi:MAG: hypothetical protein EAZ43_09620 [Betaproteobacteria bacterium]|nr:MAG: hypothetical protein EAZ43_09620 [Betaproteobacteria bacterium]
MLELYAERKASARRFLIHGVARPPICVAQDEPDTAGYVRAVSELSSGAPEPSLRVVGRVAREAAGEAIAEFQRQVGHGPIQYWAVLNFLVHALNRIRPPTDSPSVYIQFNEFTAMKNLRTSSLALIATVIAAASIASAVQAANPAGPKPNCPINEVAQLENGTWKCKPLAITSKPQPDTETEARAKNRRAELKISY